MPANLPHLTGRLKPRGCAARLDPNRLLRVGREELLLAHGGTGGLIAEIIGGVTPVAAICVLLYFSRKSKRQIAEARAEHERRQGRPSA